MKTLIILLINLLIFIALAGYGFQVKFAYNAEHAEEIAAAKAEKERKLQETTILVNNWANELAAKVKDKKKFEEFQGDGPDDSWGKALQVSYSNGLFSSKLKVSSAGPDGEFSTSDDIIAERKR